jgi:hypothetical protein
VELDHIGVPAAAKHDGMRVGFIEVDGAPVEFVQPH